MVLSTVEAAALGTGAARPPRQLRPARSFFGGARLLPLAQSMMTQLEVEVRPPAISHAISSRSRLELLSSPPRSLEVPRPPDCLPPLGRWSRCTARRSRRAQCESSSTSLSRACGRRRYACMRRERERERDAVVKHTWRWILCVRVYSLTSNVCRSVSAGAPQAHDARARLAAGAAVGPRAAVRGALARRAAAASRVCRGQPSAARPLPRLGDAAPRHYPRAVPARAARGAGGGRGFVAAGRHDCQPCRRRQ